MGLSKPLIVACVGGVACVSVYGIYKYKLNKKTTGQSHGNTNNSSQPFSSLPENETKIEVLETHNHLISFLIKEMPGNDTPEFEMIQRQAGIHIGAATAMTCTNIGDVINKLEAESLVEPGQYDFLVERILKKSGYNHYRIRDKIEEVKQKINRLLDEESNANISVTTSEPNTSQADTTRDAVVFYADTEPARNDAIRFIHDVKDFMPEATLSLEEQLGLGGLTELEAKVEATKTHRYIFILMTEDLPEDPLVKFAAGMLLDHFIKIQQDRVVPIWFSADRDRFPLYLSTLRGHNYYLMRNQADDIRQICIKGFKKLILIGRRTINPEQ